jgi:plasmid stability protein
MADVPNFEIRGMVDGGAASNGRSVFITLRLWDGQKEQDVRLFLPQDRVGTLIAGLTTFGGIARDARVKTSPDEDQDGAYTKAHALNLVDVFLDKSVTDASRAVLTLQFAADEDRKLNVLAAADSEALLKLGKSSVAAMKMLQAAEQT